MSTGARAALRRRAGAATAVALVLSGCVAACSRESTGPAMTNRTDAAVSVRSADGDVSEVEPDGGVVVLTDDCPPAPLVVTYVDGGEFTVDAPLCPGQELLVRDGAARLARSPGS